MRIIKWLFYDSYSNTVDWLKTSIIIGAFVIIIGIILLCVFGCDCRDYQSLEYRPDIDYTRPYYHVYTESEGKTIVTKHDIDLFQKGVYPPKRTLYFNKVKLLISLILILLSLIPFNFLEIKHEDFKAKADTIKLIKDYKHYKFKNYVQRKRN
jgi:hypothetical protein